MKRYEYLNFAVNNVESGQTIHFDGKEYSYDRDFDRIMERLGSEGWELVSVVPMIGSEKPMLLEMSMTYTSRVIYYFKREWTDEKVKMEQGKKEQVEQDDAFIESYLSRGYQVIYDYDNTIVFAKGKEELAFTYDKASGQWVEEE